MSQHKTSALDTEIIQLLAVVCGSVGYIEEQVTHITEGIIEKNPSKIESVKQHHLNIRKLTTDATQRTIQIFVKHKPKGDQAKILLVSWRIAVALERISVLLADSAAHSHKLDLQDIPGAKTAFINLQESLMAQTYDLVISYTAEKPQLIPQIIAKEAHIRNIYKGFFKDMMILGAKDQSIHEHIELCLGVAKNFEMTAHYIHEIAESLKYKYSL